MSLIRRGSKLLNFARQNLRILSSRAASFDGEGAAENMKTTVNILNEEHEEGIFFTNYSNTGFRLSNGMRVVGPCVVFPKSLLHWNVGSVNDINENSLSLFTVLHPKIDILVLGVGERDNLKCFNTDIIKYLKSNRINVEILDTSQALSTFNFLNSEKRYVAAALIPPAYLEEALDESEFYHNVTNAVGDVAQLQGDYYEEPSTEQVSEEQVPDVDRQTALQQMRDRLGVTKPEHLSNRNPNRRDPNRNQDY